MFLCRLPKEDYIPNIKSIKGSDNDTVENLISLPLLNYDITESDMTRESLSEIYCFHKLYGNTLPLPHPKNKTLHGKSADNLARTHLNSEMETYSSIVSDTNTTKEHGFRDDEIVTFEDSTVKSLQNMHFQPKVIKFVLGYIPTFDTKIIEMKKNKKYLPSVQKWKFTTCVSLKYLVNENQDCLTLQHMVKKILFHP